MLNLIRNPNITSSHLFRADVFWDSDKDASFEAGAWRLPDCDDGEGIGGEEKGKGKELLEVSKFVKHMKKELKPVGVVVEGFELRRSMVRQMVPRNTKLDGPLVQTCHFLRRRRKVGRSGRSMGDVGNRTVEFEDRDVLGGHSEEGCDQGEEEEDNLVVYVPHVENEDEMPWYHPKVKALCFLHTSTITSSPASGLSSPSNLSIHISPFPTHSRPGSPTPAIPTTTTSTATNNPPSSPTSTRSNPDRLTRTLQNLLKTIHRHGTGQASGYQKRVHHDRLIPQARVQDTYTRLKNKYARELLDKYWKEDLDPTKGVFEDLGIAAFVIELWGEMYEIDSKGTGGELGGGGRNKEGGVGGGEKVEKKKKKPKFPGFVDIGCGNAILDFVLLSEGYEGWGFDARARKTWDAFPEEIGMRLKEMVLVPCIFGQSSLSSEASPSISTSTGISLPSLTRPLPPSLPQDPTEPPQSTTPSIHTTQNTTSPISSIDPHNPHLQTKHGAVPTHSGLFPPGTFIISNHADELTIWTPLIAYLNESPFVSIPCCSHDLSGRRCRFPPPTKQEAQEEEEKDEVVGEERKQNKGRRKEWEKDKDKGKRKDQENKKVGDMVVSPQGHPSGDTMARRGSRNTESEQTQVGDVSLPPPSPLHPQPHSQTQTNPSNPQPQPQPNKPPSKPPKPPTQPSAYSTLCSAVSRLAAQVGYTPEEEYLRIPSTRNVAIIGRQYKSVSNGEADDQSVSNKPSARLIKAMLRESQDAAESFQTKTELVKQIVRQELGVLGLGLEDVAREWRGRAAGLAGSKRTGVRVGGEV